MIHLVDDSFVMLKSFYLLDASSTTGFFIFFDGGLGLFLHLFENCVQNPAM